jgi:hypothetical protein
MSPGLAALSDLAAAAGPFATWHFEATWTNPEDWHR